jgi:hypothetical protein
MKRIKIFFMIFAMMLVSVVSYAQKVGLVLSGGGAKGLAHIGVLKALEEKGILGGLPLGGGKILWCATEVVTKAELDETAKTVKEVLG